MRIYGIDHASTLQVAFVFYKLVIPIGGGAGWDNKKEREAKERENRGGALGMVINSHRFPIFPHIQIVALRGSGLIPSIQFHCESRLCV